MSHDDNESTYLGHPEFHRLLDKMRQTHQDKSAGYAGQDNPDPFANFRWCENIGIPAFIGALIRKNDKVSRETAIVRNPDNEKIGERIDDTLIDDSSYALIVHILFNENIERNIRFLELLHELNKQLDIEFPEDKT